MSDIVANLISDLELEGWSSKRTVGKLIFSRDGVTITCSQEHVSVQLGDFSTSKIANRYSTTEERLNHLILHTRYFAYIADDGTLAQMERWDSAQKAIQNASRDQALRSPEALHLIEQAVGILKSASARVIHKSPTDTDR